MDATTVVDSQDAEVEKKQHDKRSLSKGCSIVMVWTTTMQLIVVSL